MDLCYLWQKKNCGFDYYLCNNNKMFNYSILNILMNLILKNSEIFIFLKKAPIRFGHLQESFVW